MATPIASASGLHNYTGAAAAAAVNSSTTSTKAKDCPNPMLIAKSASATSTPPKAITASALNVKSGYEPPKAPEAPNAPACPSNVDAPPTSTAPGGPDWDSNYVSAAELLIGEFPEPFPRADLQTRKDMKTTIADIREYIHAQQKFYSALEKEIKVWRTKVQEMDLDLQEMTRNAAQLERKYQKQLLHKGKIDRQKNNKYIELAIRSIGGGHVITKFYFDDPLKEENLKRASENRQPIPDMFKISSYSKALETNMEARQAEIAAINLRIAQLRVNLATEMNKKSTSQPTILLSKLETDLRLKEQKLGWWSRQIRLIERSPAPESAAAGNPDKASEEDKNRADIMRLMKCHGENWLDALVDLADVL